MVALKKTSKFEDSKPEMVELLRSERDKAKKDFKGLTKSYKENLFDLKKRLDTALKEKRDMSNVIADADGMLREAVFSRWAVFSISSLDAQKLRYLYRDLIAMEKVGVPKLQADLNQMEQSCNDFEPVFESETTESKMAARLVRAVTKPLRDFVQQERGHAIQDIQRDLTWEISDIKDGYLLRTRERIEDAIRDEDDIRAKVLGENVIYRG